MKKSLKNEKFMLRAKWEEFLENKMERYGKITRVHYNGEGSALGDYKDIVWKTVDNKRTGIYRGVRITEEEDGYSVISNCPEKSDLAEKIKPLVPDGGYKVTFKDIEKCCYELMASGY